MTISEVSVRPIIFSGPMVRAILDGRKTQTRRVIKHYGQVGDHLWVKETWAGMAGDDSCPPIDMPQHPGTLFYKADDDDHDPRRSIRGKWRPSIFMPQWASRLTLEITSVRVQRIWEISEEDIIAEGCPKDYLLGLNWFRPLWDSLNAKRGYSWESDPWCWCLTFKVLRQEFPHA